MEKKRKAIRAGELYVILDREFRTRQARECRSCYILLPYRVDRMEDGNANWEIVLPPDCPYGCAGLVEEIVQEYSQLYDLNGGESD